METFNDVISGNGLVLVDFFATWCGPCKMMHPVLEQVKATLGDKIRIIKVDVDKHNDTAGRYGIQSVPGSVSKSVSGRNSKKGPAKILTGPNKFVILGDKT